MEFLFKLALVLFGVYVVARIVAWLILAAQHGFMLAMGL